MGVGVGVGGGVGVGRVEAQTLKSRSTLPRERSTTLFIEMFLVSSLAGCPFSTRFPACT